MWCGDFISIVKVVPKVFLACRKRFPDFDGDCMQLAVGALQSEECIHF